MFRSVYEFHTDSVDYGRHGEDFVLASSVGMEFKKEETSQTLQDATHEQIDAKFIERESVCLTAQRCSPTKS